jgi:hypothetical protein
LTPRQLRASLAGQQYYIDHFNGTYATHAQLCAFLEAKRRRWQYTNTSTDWQIYYIGGWHAALLADPTAEQEQPATPSAGPEGGNDGGWDAPLMARPTYGEPLDAPLMARAATFGREDEEDRRPIFPPEDAAIKAQARPNCGKDDDEDRRPGESDTGPAVTLAARSNDGDIQLHVTNAAAITARAVYGPENDDEPGERRPARGPENDDEAEGPITAVALRHRIAQAHSVTPHCYVMAPPIREPEDDDDGALYHPKVAAPINAQPLRSRLERALWIIGMRSLARPMWEELASASSGTCDPRPAVTIGGQAAMSDRQLAVTNAAAILRPFPLIAEQRGRVVLTVWGDLYEAPECLREREQRGGAFIPTLGDEDGSGPGWGMMYPTRPEEDDGNGQRPASLPSFPRKPSSGAAILVACEAQQKEAALCH